MASVTGSRHSSVPGWRTEAALVGKSIAAAHISKIPTIVSVSSAKMSMLEDKLRPGHLRAERLGAAEHTARGN